MEIIKNSEEFKGCDFVVKLDNSRKNTKVKILQITDMQFIDSLQRRTFLWYIWQNEKLNNSWKKTPQKKISSKTKLLNKRSEPHVQVAFFFQIPPQVCLHHRPPTSVSSQKQEPSFCSAIKSIWFIVKWRESIFTLAQGLQNPGTPEIVFHKIRCYIKRDGQRLPLLAMME